MESEAAELYRAGRRRVFDLQHDFGFGRAAARGNWNRAGVGREPRDGANGVSRRGGESRLARRADRVAARSRNGQRRGQIDVGDGRSAVRQQPASDHRAGSRFDLAGSPRRSWSRGCVSVCPSARSVAGCARRSDGVRTARVCRASSQDARSCDRDCSCGCVRWRHRACRLSAANRCSAISRRCW